MRSSNAARVAVVSPLGLSAQEQMFVAPRNESSHSNAGGEHHNTRQLRNASRTATAAPRAHPLQKTALGVRPLRGGCCNWQGLSPVLMPLTGLAPASPYFGLRAMGRLCFPK